jgi:uncharacterized protein (TIGR00159 family)
LEGLSARDVVVTCLDIFIVYYVMYRVLLTIKGTRAAQMVIGIVLIGAGFFVAERLEMTTVSWLLDNFINYFIIIVIVVFQQDIRRGLMRLGQRVGAFGRTHAVTHALDEVLAACDHLAKARIGGIVVFEREADLGDFIDHGQTIDAQLSRELLATLFVPSRDNKLHDGAVIIDKTLRIRNAGAVLPLSRNEQLAQEFGTRHRAALGITEETDAVAIVVSEERGEVSLCYRGSIARDLEIDTLRSALQGLFGDEKGREQVSEGAKAAAEIARGLAALAAESSASSASSASSSSSSSLASSSSSTSIDGADIKAAARASTQRPAEEAGS